MCGGEDAHRIPHRHESGSRGEPWGATQHFPVQHCGAPQVGGTARRSGEHRPVNTFDVGAPRMLDAYRRLDRVLYFPAHAYEGGSVCHVYWYADRFTIGDRVELASERDVDSNIAAADTHG